MAVQEDQNDGLEVSIASNNTVGGLRGGKNRFLGSTYREKVVGVAATGLFNSHIFWITTLEGSSESKGQADHKHNNL